MDIENENQVLENEYEPKLMNEENDQDQPINTSKNKKIPYFNKIKKTYKHILKEVIKEGKNVEELGDVDIEENVPPPRDLVNVFEEIDEFLTLLEECKEHVTQSVTEDSESEPAPPDLPIAVERFTAIVKAMIAEYDSNDCPVKWDQLTDEDRETLLGAVDRMSKLLRALGGFPCESKYVDSINNLARILERAMVYLEEEFKDFLEYHKVSEEDEDNETNSIQEGDEDNEAESDQGEERINYICGYSEETMVDLSKLVRILMVGGHETECCQIYLGARRCDLEKKLQKHEFDKHSVDDVPKMHWEALEKYVISWNETMKDFTSTHFINEHNLSATVFRHHLSIAESLFSTLAKGIIVQLLKFPVALATTKRAMEKLFKYLDVYESLRDLHSTLEDLVAEEYAEELKCETSLTRGRLGEAMISIFFELETSIKADSGKNPVPGGAVHPLTRNTMNYLEHACEYKETLEEVFRVHQTSDWDTNDTTEDQPENSCNTSSNVKKPQSPFETQLVKVLELLHDNIESKSKHYKDYPLRMIFLMNNGRYILQKVKACGAANGSLNDTWCRKRSSCLRQYHKNYQRETWSKLLNVLINHEGLLVNGKIMKPVLKERFKSFNSMFDDIIKTQTSWVISDEQLQSEMRVSISNMVVPAYRSFMGRFSPTFSPGRQTEKYVKFQPEDVEAKIDGMFDGSATSSGRRKP